MLSHTSIPPMSILYFAFGALNLNVVGAVVGGGMFFCMEPAIAVLCVLGDSAKSKGGGTKWTTGRSL